MYPLRRAWAELKSEVLVLPSRTLVLVWALALLGGLEAAAGEHREATARATEAARIAPHLAADVARLIGSPDTARAMLASRTVLESTPRG